MVSQNTIIDYRKRIITLKNKGIDFKKDVLGQLNKFYSNENTKRTYMCAVLKMYEMNEIDIPENQVIQIKKEIMEIQQRYENNQKSQEMTSYQKENWPEDSLIEKVFNDYNLDYSKMKIDRDSHRKLQRHLLTLLYMKNIPPLRSDYTRTVIGNENENYYNVKTKQFIITKFKKSEKKDPIIINVDDNIHEKILLMLQFRFTLGVTTMKRNSGNYGFINMPLLLNYNLTESLTPITLNQEFKQMFKKNISTTMLRRWFLSKKFPVRENESFDKREQVAKSMGNSTNVQHIYIKKK